MTTPTSESKLLRREILTALKREKGRQKREQFKKEPAKPLSNYNNFWANVSGIKIGSRVKDETSRSIKNAIERVV
jgi:hypothetical protein